MVSKLKFGKPHRQMLWVLFFSALFFSIVAIAQYIFVENQARKTALSQLNHFTQEVIGAINYTDHWDLKKYRQADILATNFYIIAENGVVIDIEGFIPDLIPSPKFLISLKSLKPETVTTSLGETWQVLLKNIKDGSVVLGISNPDNLEVANKKLFENAEKFNNLSVNQVARPSFPREIDADIEYSVFDTNGNLKIQLGGIPLELDKINLSKLAATVIQERNIGGREYLTLVTPIIDLSNKVVGRILIPLDISLQQKALKIQERFNFLVAVLSWGMVILLLCWYVVTDERAKRKSQISLQEGLKSGESQVIEFKETLEFDVKSNAPNQGVLKSTLKTVAAFLNSTGGTLFIGVSDIHEIKGLERDFRFCKGKNVDGFQQKLRDLICSRFHPTPWGKVNLRFESVNNLVVCAIDAQALSKPEVVHFDGELYVREGNTTRKLEGPHLTNWLQERFQS
jgi:schlafen family protein